MITIDIDIPDAWLDDPELAGLGIIELGRINAENKLQADIDYDNSTRRAFEEGESLHDKHRHRT